jgi:hypothetical protein
MTGALSPTRWLLLAWPHSASTAAYRVPSTAPLGWKSAGRRVIFVNPTATSIDCHACGARCGRPRQDTVVCPLHGNLDTDLNGARNIATRAGLGSGQASGA